MAELPSLHDNFLVSYEVDCEARRIKLRARRDERVEANRGLPVRTIVFAGVEGYQFENDAFGNIIFSLECVPIEHLLGAYGSRIAESYRLAGAPGPWAANLASAAQSLKAKRIQAFELSSSYGISGWILAKEAVVEHA